MSEKHGYQNKHEYEIIERKWNPQDGTWDRHTMFISRQLNKDLKTGKKNERVIMGQIKVKNTSSTHLVSVSWGELKTIIEFLSHQYSKEEVEKELGIKIKAEKRAHGGR